MSQKVALVIKAENGASPEENDRTVTLCGLGCPRAVPCLLCECQVASQWSLGRRSGRVSGDWDGKGLESLKAGKGCLCQVNQETPLPLGQACMESDRQTAVDTTHFLWNHKNFLHFAKACDLLEQQALPSEQFLLGTFTSNR